MEDRKRKRERILGNSREKGEELREEGKEDGEKGRWRKDRKEVIVQTNITKA